MGNNSIDLIIIGAGPFGLSAASFANFHKIDYLVIGKPMSFWKENIPENMYLRSGLDWHLDPQGKYTIEAFINTKNKPQKNINPLPLSLFLEYATWFQDQQNIHVLEKVIEKLDYLEEERKYLITLKDANTIKAKNVLIAIGFKFFIKLPHDLLKILPADSFTHTCDTVNFEKFKNKLVLIIGGRQSAYEWAALIVEAGAKTIHISHRHETPEFAESNWEWIDPFMDQMVDNPKWYSALTEQEKEEIDRKFWTEDSLKLEPWLLPRINRDNVKIWPLSNVIKCDESESGKYIVHIDNGDKLEVDHIILATGYKVDINNVPFLSSGNILSKLKINEGFPDLDGYLQTNLPGLYMTSLIATKSFGRFFAYTVSCRTSSNIIGSHIINSLKN
ncbi:MAG: NAD(P)-binding domain-containing protein [Thermodesulfobacteriota bacterium]